MGSVLRVLSAEALLSVFNSSCLAFQRLAYGRGVSTEDFATAQARLYLRCRLLHFSASLPSLWRCGTPWLLVGMFQYFQSCPNR